MAEESKSGILFPSRINVLASQRFKLPSICFSSNPPKWNHRPGLPRAPHMKPTQRNTPQYVQTNVFRSNFVAEKISNFKTSYYLDHHVLPTTVTVSLLFPQFPHCTSSILPTSLVPAYIILSSPSVSGDTALCCLSSHFSIPVKMSRKSYQSACVISPLSISNQYYF